MDALKRAEKARQEQAEQADAVGEGTEPGKEQELTLDPLSPSQILRTEALFADTKSLDQEKLPWDIGDTGESATVEDIADGKPAAAKADVKSDSELSDASLSMDFGKLSLDDDTSATLPSMKSAQRSVDDYFDGTHSMSMSMEQIRDARQDAEESGPHKADHLAGTRSDATTKQTARAVFDSKLVRPSASRRVATVVLPLLVLALITGAGFMYWDQLLELVNGKPSLVNTPPRRQMNAAPQVTVSVPAAAPEAASGAAKPAPAPANPSVQASAQPDSSQPISGTVVPAREPVAKVEEPSPPTQPVAVEATDGSQATKPTAAQIDAAAVKDESLQSMADQALAQALPAAPVDLAAQLRKLNPEGTAQQAPVSFRITRKRSTNHVHKDTLNAYAAFQAGDNARAMALYRKVVETQT